MFVYINVGVSNVRFENCLYHLEVAVKIVDGLLLLATSKESEILMDVKKEIQGIIDKYRDHL